MKMAKYKVVEKFISINGESKAAGELACFIRFGGCNLCCSYCDTKWANKEDACYEEMTGEAIYDYVKATGLNNVTLTGGEPLLQENIGELIRHLSSDKSIRVEIETNGSISIRKYLHFAENVTFTLDYKLPGSGMDKYMCMENYEILRPVDTVKFVVSDRTDLDVAKEIIEKYKLTDRVTVYLSSAFSQIEPADIVDYMIDNKMNKVKLQLQMHKYIWEPDRKGV